MAVNVVGHTFGLNVGANNFTLNYGGTLEPGDVVVISSGTANGPHCTSITSPGLTIDSLGGMFSEMLHSATIDTTIANPSFDLTFSGTFDNQCCLLLHARSTTGGITFDPDASLPAITGGSTPPTAVYSTSAADCLVCFFIGCTVGKIQFAPWADPDIFPPNTVGNGFGWQEGANNSGGFSAVAQALYLKQLTGTVTNDTAQSTAISTGGVYMVVALYSTPPPGPFARASQIVLEILAPNLAFSGGGMLAIFPALIGQMPTVVKRVLGSTGADRAGSGREVRVGYWSVNMWEWELSYDFLPDKIGGTTATDLKALMGFFVKQIADFGRFLFDDEDDDTARAQPIGTTDGTSTTWQIYRNFGGDVTNPPEAVGVVNAGHTVSVYLDGVLQNPITYTIVTTTPCMQLLVFNSAPTTGQVITMDFDFYFLVKFKDDHQDFQKFMQKLWDTSKLTLASLRN